MLYLIGLGLNDEGDIPIKALDAMKGCAEVYAELYTSAWKGDLGQLEKRSGKKIEILPREKVESDFLVKRAETRPIALLIPGDPLAATTHIDLLMRAKKAGIEVKVIHASSIFTAIAECGLQLYKFGRTTTVPKPQQGFTPTSPLETIAENAKSGLHTLVLLDIPMKISEGLQILLEMEEKLRLGIISRSSKVVACAAIGDEAQVIKCGTIAELTCAGIEQTPACIVVPGKLHFSEEEALELYAKK
ncbi:MAG: diphthine synthase [Candidatus Aenigmatarchaeota archaeon]